MKFEIFLNYLPRFLNKSRLQGVNIVYEYREIIYCAFALKTLSNFDLSQPLENYSESKINSKVQ